MTDGTAANTQLVKDINPGSGGSYPSSFVGMNSVVYFEANDGTHGYELWRSDGTNAGTYLVADIDPGSGSGISGPIVNFHNELFFQGDDGVHGWELWESNGTTLGTQMLIDINNVGSASSYPRTSPHRQLPLLQRERRHERHGAVAHRRDGRRHRLG